MDGQRSSNGGGVGGGTGADEVTPAPALRRLFDRPGVTWSPSEARAVGLLRAAKPYQETPGRKERVGNVLAETRGRSSRLLLRPLAVIGIVVGGGAVSSAAVWHWPARVVDAYERLTPRLAAPTSRPEREHPVSRHHVVSAYGTPQLDGNDGIAETHVAVTPIGKAFAPSHPIETAPAPTPAATSRHELVARAHAQRPVPIRAGEDTTPVLAAMRALRRAHDPLRARLLLDAYLAQNPQGALAEEALALSIEAAVAHGDPDAGALADRYLRLYPAGPFRNLARQTLASLSAPLAH